MDHDKNKHCVTTLWSDRYFFKDGRAAGEAEAYDRVDLYAHNQRYPTLSFEMPRQRHEMERVDEMMRKAYERGRSDNRSELGKLLQTLIAV